MKRSLYPVIWLVTTVLLAGGCTTINKSGLLEVDLGQKQSSIEGVKFALLVDNVNLTAKAREYYPNLFSDDYTALPVIVSRSCQRNRNEIFDDGTGPFAVLLSVVAPFPFFDYTQSCKGEFVSSGAEGYLVKKPFAYSWVATNFFSINPVYWILMPFFNESEAELSEDQVVVENVVRALKEVDQRQIKDSQSYRRSRLQQVTIEGRPYWAFIGLEQSEKARKENGGFDTATVMLFNENPKFLVAPQERVVVAQKDGSRWHTRDAYLRHLGLKRLTAASVSIENGRPARVAIRENVTPQVENFLFLDNDRDMNEIRWSNNLLIEAKNTSLLRLLQQGSRQEITDLITRIEKEILNLNEKAQMAESQVQQMVVAGGDPKAANEMAVLYRQRITIFEAILSALKRAGTR